MKSDSQLPEGANSFAMQAAGLPCGLVIGKEHP